MWCDITDRIRQAAVSLKPTDMLVGHDFDPDLVVGALEIGHPAMDMNHQDPAIPRLTRQEVLASAPPLDAESNDDYVVSFIDELTCRCLQFLAGWFSRTQVLGPLLLLHCDVLPRPTCCACIEVTINVWLYICELADRLAQITEMSGLDVRAEECRALLAWQLLGQELEDPSQRFNLMQLKNLRLLPAVSAEQGGRIPSLLDLVASLSAAKSCPHGSRVKLRLSILHAFLSALASAPFSRCKSLAVELLGRCLRLLRQLSRESPSAIPARWFHEPLVRHLAVSAPLTRNENIQPSHWDEMINVLTQIASVTLVFAKLVDNVPIKEAQRIVRACSLADLSSYGQHRCKGAQWSAPEWAIGRRWQGCALFINALALLYVAFRDCHDERSRDLLYRAFFGPFDPDEISAAICEVRPGIRAAILRDRGLFGAMPIGRWLISESWDAEEIARRVCRDETDFIDHRASTDIEASEELERVPRKAAKQVADAEQQLIVAGFQSGCERTDTLMAVMSSLSDVVREAGLESILQTPCILDLLLSTAYEVACTSGIFETTCLADPVRIEVASWISAAIARARGCLRNGEHQKGFHDASVVLATLSRVSYGRTGVDVTASFPVMTQSLRVLAEHIEINWTWLTAGLHGDEPLLRTRLEVGGEVTSGLDFTRFHRFARRIDDSHQFAQMPAMADTQKQLISAFEKSIAALSVQAKTPADDSTLDILARSARREFLEPHGAAAAMAARTGYELANMPATLLPLLTVTGRLRFRPLLDVPLLDPA